MYHISQIREFGTIVPANHDYIKCPTQPEVKAVFILYSFSAILILGSQYFRSHSGAGLPCERGRQSYYEYIMFSGQIRVVLPS